MPNPGPSLLPAQHLAALNAAGAGNSGVTTTQDGPPTDTPKTERNRAESVAA